jgi:hypothetical protein
MDASVDRMPILPLREWHERLKREGLERLHLPHTPVLVATVRNEEEFVDQTVVTHSGPPPTKNTQTVQMVIAIQRKGLNGAGSLALGRAPICDVVIPFSPVSKVHAYLRVQGGIWSITDVGSTNGTKLNGTPVSPNSWLQVSDGDAIAFGSLSTRFWLPKSFLDLVQAPIS